MSQQTTPRHQVGATVKVQPRGCAPVVGRVRERYWSGSRWMYVVTERGESVGNFREENVTA